MRAFVMREHGDLDVLGEAEIPTPTVTNTTDVRIAIVAAALNRLDLWTLRGLPGVTLELPHVLGGDGAGVVESVGDSVTKVKPGDEVLINPGVSCYGCDQCSVGEHSQCRAYRILGEHLPGTLCEYVVVPEVNVAPIPALSPPHEAISWEEAAAFGLVTLTAWRMIVSRARVRPSETVLIWGIGGGVSSSALQIAKLAGAFVIVTSSSDEKLKVAREIGADVGLNHGTVDVAREVRRLTHRRGVDVVVDNVGEATWEQSLRALGKGGRLVTCGGTTGPMVVTDIRRLFWNQYTLMGSTMGNALEFAEIVRVLGQGKLRPRIDSIVSLECAREAFERLDRAEQMGKIVVTMRDPAQRR